MSTVIIEPFEIIAGAPEAGVIFLCDHASNALPEAYGTLGLVQEEMETHIAYDKGVAWVTRALAHHFDAPAILTRFSRLLIDPNRGTDDPTLVMRLADNRIIPGNAGVDAAEIDRRRRLFWNPYHDQIRQCIDMIMAAGHMPALVGVHSFTPTWRGVLRPWQVGILWDRDPRLAVPVIDDLRKEGVTVGDNAPYDGALEGDTMNVHGSRRGLAHMLIELRQDLLANETEAQSWAARLIPSLTRVLADPQVRVPHHYASRAGRNRFRLAVQES
jgi:predicted N-formylglutamate amidohydrolase